jgi:glucokinase
VITGAGQQDFVLGIDFGGTKVALATADLVGRVLATDRIATVSRSGAEQVIDRAVAAAHGMLASQVSAGGTCRGVGAASPGVLRDGRFTLAPNIPGWDRILLAERLRDGLGVDDVACANDVKAAGWAEARWGALHGADPALLVNLGTGISAALIAGGRVIAGANGAAGEIGYQLLGPDTPAGALEEAERPAGPDTPGGAADGAPEGAAGGAARRAPLEEYVSGSGLARRGAELLGAEITTSQLFGSAHPRAVRLVSTALDTLAVHVANLVIALDPARVAVGGGLMASADRVLPPLRWRLEQAVPFPPELVPAAFQHDSALRGAIALIIGHLAGERVAA